MNPSYSHPVSQLLTLGQFFEDVNERSESWRAYAKLGFDNRHIPELIAMVTDEALHDGYEPVPFAPVHAWRILAELKASDALPAFLSLLHRLDDEEDGDDWIAREFPSVFRKIGGESVDVLAAFAADERNGIYARSTACGSLGEIASALPDERGRCLEILTSILKSFEKNDPVLNAAIVAVLIDLDSVESIDLIRDAFAEDRVDLDFIGDLEDVEIEFGLRTKRSTGPRGAKLFRQFWELPDIQEATRPRTVEPKIGRNDPCWCGSGKKFKKCCLNA